MFAVAYSPKGNIVAAGYQDASIRLWDANSGKLIRLLEVDADMVSGVAFSNDEKQLVSAGGDGTVRLWDVATGKPLQRLETGAHLHSLSLSADGTRALCAGDVFNKAMWTIQLWDLKKGERIRRPGDESSTNVHAVAISPDGRWALSGGQDSIVRLWDVASGQKLQELPDHSGWLGAPAFSFDGRMALSFSLGPDKSIRLWKWEQGKLVLARRLDGHKGGVRSAAFSPNGRLVVSNGVDKACRRVTTFLGQ